MTEFDYSQYDNGDDYTTVDAIYDMLHQADHTSRPMSILLECYNKYENHTSEADAIANDKEALDWLDDYWEYVCWNERGNEPSMDEVGGFKGMAETITNPHFAQQVIDYLQYDDEIDDDTQNLINRLKQITSRYNGVSKMKKSNDLYNIKNEYNSLSRKEKDIVERLCWTLQVNDPIIEKRGDDYYFLFSYYDGDPEYYFEDLNIEQNREGEYNYFNLSEIIRNPPEFMKSTKKMKKNVDIEQLAHDIATIYEDIDPYAQRSAFNTFDDAVRGQYEALTTWSADEIEMSMINDLQEYADDGYEGDGTLRIDDIISRLREVVNMKKNMKKMKKSIPSIHDMIAQTRANNNSLVKSRVDLTKKDNSIDKNWSDYQRLREMKDDGTIMEIIMCMNGISSGEGNKFEKLVDGCLSVPLAVSLRIKETYTPRTLPLLPSREYRITATYRDGPAYVVQFGCDESELSSMVRFTISDSGTAVLTCIWDTISHEKIGELRNQVSISSIDEIENIFIVADEMLDEIYSELE